MMRFVMNFEKHRRNLCRNCKAETGDKADKK
jgi:hypothetical protein